MTTTTLHPVLGTPLPPVTAPVQAGLRDWAWTANARRRRALVALVLSHSALMADSWTLSVR